MSPPDRAQVLVLHPRISRVTPEKRRGRGSRRRRGRSGYIPKLMPSSSSSSWFTLRHPLEREGGSPLLSSSRLCSSRNIQPSHRGKGRKGKAANRPPPTLPPSALRTNVLTYRRSVYEGSPSYPALEDGFAICRCSRKPHEATLMAVRRISRRPFWSSLRKYSAMARGAVEPRGGGGGEGGGPVAKQHQAGKRD